MYRPRARKKRPNMVWRLFFILSVSLLVILFFRSGSITRKVGKTHFLLHVLRAEKNLKCKLSSRSSHADLCSCAQEDTPVQTRSDLRYAFSDKTESAGKRVTREELLVVIPSDEAHLPLVRASRKWRKVRE